MASVKDHFYSDYILKVSGNGIKLVTDSDKSVKITGGGSSSAYGNGALAVTGGVGGF